MGFFFEKRASGNNKFLKFLKINNKWDKWILASSIYSFGTIAEKSLSPVRKELERGM